MMMEEEWGNGVQVEKRWEELDMNTAEEWAQEDKVWKDSDMAQAEECSQAENPKENWKAE